MNFHLNVIAVATLGFRLLHLPSFLRLNHLALPIYLGKYIG